MSGRRERALLIALAAAGVLLLLFDRSYSVLLNDYGTEAHASYAALLSGRVGSALAQAPVYGGSLELRAPFALLSGLWSGGALAIYRLAALPCLVAGAALGVWLAGRLDHSRAGRVVVVLVCAANPLTFRAMVLGHPEELLGGVLCVCAVLAAGRRRPVLAGLLLGLAVANKEWAILATGPVLLALPGRRASMALAAVGVLAVLEAPLLLAWGGGLGGTAAGRLAVADSQSAIFHPWQAWWFLGDSHHVVRDLIGRPRPGYRIAPPWLGGWIHALIAWLVLPLTLLSRSSARRPGAALELLALLLLLRCLLDPWNVAYYALPCIVTVGAWEVLVRRSIPRCAAAASAWVWLVFGPLDSASIAPDLKALLFVVPATACALWLGRRLLRTPQLSAALTPRTAALS